MGVRALQVAFWVNVAAALAQDLPMLEYKYAVFAVEHPSVAQTFFDRYTGAEVLAKEDFQIYSRPSAEVAGSRLAYRQNSTNKFSDVYFVSELGSGEPGAAGPITDGQAVDASHTWAQDDWDWHQDRHLGFRVDDLDAMAARLMRDAVPFVNHGAPCRDGPGGPCRGGKSQYNGDGSLYFGIPGTGVTIKVEGEASLYWTMPYIYCSRTADDTTGRMTPYSMNVTSIDDALGRPIPEFVPVHQSMTSTDSGACADWATRFLGVTAVYAQTDTYDVHQFAGGVCADIRWLEVSPGGPQIRFNQQFRKRQGHIKVADFEKHMRDVRGEKFQDFDAYMNLRFAFAVEDIAPYRAVFDRANESYFLVEETRMIVSPPNSYAIELYVASLTSGSCNLPLTTCHLEITVVVVTIVAVLVLGCVAYVFFKPVKSARAAADFQASLQPTMG